MKVSAYNETDNDYNMNISALFKGHLNSSEHPVITKALVAALAKLGVTVEKSAIIYSKYGHSVEVRLAFPY